MKHYCRYCSHCIGQDESIGLCEKKNETIKRTSIRNACIDFNFCETDAFYYNRSDNPEDAKYKLREPKNKECVGQLSLFEDSIQNIKKNKVVNVNA